MNIYVFENVDRVSDMYHADGGVVIVTDRDPAVVWREQNIASYDDEVISPSGLPEPSIVGTAEGPERVVIFPDAGCC